MPWFGLSNKQLLLDDKISQLLAVLEKRRHDLLMKEGDVSEGPTKSNLKAWRKEVPPPKSSFKEFAKLTESSKEDLVPNLYKRLTNALKQRQQTLTKAGEYAVNMRARTSRLAALKTAAAAKLRAGQEPVKWWDVVESEPSDYNWNEMGKREETFQRRYNAQPGDLKIYDPKTVMVDAEGNIKLGEAKSSIMSPGEFIRNNIAKRSKILSDVGSPESRMVISSVRNVLNTDLYAPDPTTGGQKTFSAMATKARDAENLKAKEASTRSYTKRGTEKAAQHPLIKLLRLRDLMLRYSFKIWLGPQVRRVGRTLPYPSGRSLRRILKP